jgi:hypothetical protein
MKTAFGDPIPEESMRVFFFRAIIKFPQSSFFPNDDGVFLGSRAFRKVA